MSINEFLQGFIIGSSLIIAIGPQNLFVINQGLKKNYTLVVVLICSLSDSLLIICGIYLSNSILNFNESLIIFMKLIGGVWLIFYGIMKIKNARSHIIENKEFKSLPNLPWAKKFINIPTILQKENFFRFRTSIKGYLFFIRPS